MMKKQTEAEKPVEEKKESAVRSEIQDYLDERQQRRWIFPRAALVGGCAGAVALGFRVVLTESDLLRNNLITWAHTLPFLGWLFPVVLTFLGAGISVAITRRYAPEASGSGIPHLEAVLHRYRKLDWKRILPVKFFAGIIAIGSGLALGREGPTVQMGGALGEGISRLLKVSEHERLTLISAGAGAGLAAAFNAPLSGLIFVLEEVRSDFQPIMFGATFVAAIIADVITRVGSGQFPVFNVPNYPVPPLSALPVFAVLGIITGLLGVAYNKSLLATVNFFGRIPAKRVVPAAALVGGAIGLVGWFYPQIIGSGNSLAEATLQGNLLLTIVPIYFGLRFILSISSYGTGAPGGIFAPLLVMGSLIGLAIGQIFHFFEPTVVPIPAVFAVVGMAAYFTAIVRAPLTGIMLITEMTGDYALMLPLLVSCFCAYAIAEFLKDLPVYEALLERDLRNGSEIPPLKDPAVLEFIVQPDSYFSGRSVSGLGLPPGCILVRCSDGKREWVPKANTRLDAHMHITVVVSPEATNGIKALRDGCASRK